MAQSPIPEFRYRTKKFTTELPAMITHSTKGDLIYQVLNCGPIKKEEWGSSFSSIQLEITFFGRKFQILADANGVTSQGEVPTGFDQEEIEGLLGHIEFDFMQQMGVE